MNFQSFAVNAFMVNWSLDNGVHKQVIMVFCRVYCDFFVLNKCILLVHIANPLLLLYALIEIKMSYDFVIRVTVIRVTIIWS